MDIMVELWLFHFKLYSVELTPKSSAILPAKHYLVQFKSLAGHIKKICDRNCKDANSHKDQKKLIQRENLP